MRRIKIKRIRNIAIAVLMSAFVIYCVGDLIKNISSYKHIVIGDGYISVPKQVMDDGKMLSSEFSVYIENDRCKILGFEDGTEEVRQDYIDKIGLSKEIIQQLGRINDVATIQLLIGIEESSIIDSGELHKPSFNQYLIRYSVKNDAEMCIVVFQKDNKDIVQIMELSPEYLSENQIKKIIEGIGI